MEKIGFGLVLIFLVIIGGGFKYIFDWGSAELWGRNTFTLVLIVGGVYLIYKGIKARKKV